MDPLLQVVVLASNTCDSLELAQEAAQQALRDAIEAALAGGVTIEDIESEAGIELARPNDLI